MDHEMHKRISKLEYLANEQDRLAKANEAKGEPNFNLHSVAAEQLRREAGQLRRRAIEQANKQQRN